MAAQNMEHTDKQGRPVSLQTGLAIITALLSTLSAWQASESRASSAETRAAIAEVKAQMAQRFEQAARENYQTFATRESQQQMIEQMRRLNTALRE
jgi:hypothetical protein